MSTRSLNQVYDCKIQSGECPSDAPAPTDICKHLRTPVWLIGCVMSMLRQYFGSEERIALEAGTFSWHDEVDKSKLFIGDDFNWNFENIGQRPALIVEVAGIQTIQEIPTLGHTGLIGYNAAESIYSFATIEEGTMLVRVIAKQKLECWALAWETKLFLQSYADALREAYGFRKFHVSRVDSPVPFKEFAEYKVATIHVPFSMIDAWGIRRENLRVQSIDPALSLDGGNTPFQGI